MSQKDYTLKMLELFELIECNSYKTPMCKNTKLLNDMGVAQVDLNLYKKW
jgi:hypothetical protein